ncbi:hypothetical protein B0H13DRAFT_1892812 [Mycena leptocephala]|nr:hypothetical protein B0H13DRAFT_1892812 [Mycena leptocephala]
MCRWGLWASASVVDGREYDGDGGEGEGGRRKEIGVRCPRREPLVSLRASLTTPRPPSSLPPATCPGAETAVPPTPSSPPSLPPSPLPPPSPASLFLLLKADSSSPSGQAEASNVLSFMGVIFGFAVGWVSLASDYNVYQPAGDAGVEDVAWTYREMSAETGTRGWRSRSEMDVRAMGCGCERAVDEDEMVLRDGLSSQALLSMQMPSRSLARLPLSPSSLSSPFLLAQRATILMPLSPQAGLIFPLVLIQWLGAAIMCVAGGPAPSNDAWAAAYAADELGGLLGAVLVPAVGNFGKFCMVLLVLSVVANNIINVYSMGLSISVIGVWLAKVPRLIWPIVITAIYIPIAIAGANSFSSSLEDFMNVLGYWLSIFVVVVLLEHFVFRKGDWAQYNAAETWNRQDKTPVGIAALVAFLFGALGTAMGMAQIWEMTNSDVQYIGKIGALVGGSANPFGGDIGFELSGAFAGIVYLPARYLELKYIGR